MKVDHHKTTIVAILFFICFCCLHVHAMNPMKPLFDAWKATHQKSYHSPAEEALRYHIWTQNNIYIQLHNQRNNTGFTLKMNQFGDLTPREFATQILSQARQVSGAETTVSGLNFADPLPPSVDWRTKGVVPPIKDAGSCALAYGEIECMESTVAIATGKLPNFESVIIPCIPGCNKEFDIIERAQICGLWPGNGNPTICTYNPNDAFEVLSSVITVIRGNETDLQAVVATKGPVSVDIDASHTSFQFYDGGIYYEASCNVGLLDHNVLVVGYGSEGTNDYWIVQNSWGTVWGNKGSILMARNRNNNCGIATAGVTGVYGTNNPKFHPQPSCWSR